MKSPPSAWAICCAARKITAERRRPTNRWGRPRSLIRRLCRKPTWGLGRCTILLQKRDLALAKYQAVVANDGSTAPAEIARKRMKEAYREN